MSIPGSASPLFFQAAAAADATFAEIANSLRFNSADSAFLNKTFSSAGNRKTFTFSCWVKRAKLGVRQFIFEAGSSDTATDRFMIRFQADDTLMVTVGQATNRQTSQVFRDVGAWANLVVAVNTTASTANDRIKIYWNGSQITDFSSTSNPSLNANTGVSSAAAHSIGKTHIDNSHYLDAYLADIYLIDGTAHDASKFGAYDDNGVWQAIVPSGLTFGTNGFHLKFASTSTTAALGTDSSGNSHTFTTNNFSVGTPVYFVGDNSGLDSYIPSGWTNTTDPSNVLNNNNTGVLINQSGSLYFAITPTSSSISIKWIVYDGSGTYNPTVSLNTSSSWNGTTVHPSSTSGNGSSGNPSVGTYSVTSGTTYYVRTGLTGSGNPALVVYITNVTIAAVATDMVPADFSKDSPTTDTTNTDSGAGGELSGNYCVLNPLAISGTLSNGNLEGQCPIGSSQHASFAIPASGKWYFEAEMTNSGILNFGLAAHRPAGHIYQNSNSVLYSTSGVKNVDGVTDQSYGATWSSGDIIGCACDADAGTITFYKNNSSQGALSHQIAGLFPSFGNGGVATNYQVNFGQRAFTYNAPSNHKALCTTNLPTPTIADGTDYFDTKLYTGNGSSYLNSQTISGLSFSPDFLWIKCRSNTSDNHLADTVNGINKNLESNNTGQNQTNNNNGWISATTSDGFTVVYGGIDGLQTNDNSKTYVAWAWEAASSTASNTDGSITSSVRANSTAGFSIVAWTSSSSVSTVGHGLNAAPHFIITKNRSTTNAWWSYHSSLGNTKAIRLDTTDAPSTMSSTWNNTSPTNSVFTVGGEFGNGNNMIAYCFAPVDGYSAFGSYEGNGSTSQGPFIYTGFAPAFLIFRRYNNTGDWIIFDNKRNTHAGNYRERVVYANKTNAEEDAANGDTHLFLSNGFAIDNVNFGYWNASGDDYLWAAFAKNPFQANGGLAR